MQIDHFPQRRAEQQADPKIGLKFEVKEIGMLKLQEMLKAFVMISAFQFARAWVSGQILWFVLVAVGGRAGNLYVAQPVAPVLASLLKRSKGREVERNWAQSMGSSSLDPSCHSC